MSNKTFTRFVAIMTAALVILFVGLVKVTYGSEVLPEPKPTNILDTVKKHTSINQPANDVTVFIKNEWEDIKYFQRTQWQEGKEQLAKNKEQVKGYWETIAEALGTLATTNEQSDKETR